MTRSTEWLSKWIYILATGMYFVAVGLRTWLHFRDGPVIGRAMGLLLLWLLFLISEPLVSRRWSIYFPIYLTIQTFLVFVLMGLPGTPDFVGALLGVLSMQAMLHLPTRVVALWIGICAIILVLLLGRAYQSQAYALALIYTAENIFLSAYIRTIRLAHAARLENQTLANEMELANQRLQDYSTKLEQLAVARERNRLARELHDSVTQTVFSMNLTSQSAVLLYERDQAQVGAQLERLYELTRSALAEMQLLIDELKPSPAQPAGLAQELGRLMEDGRFSHLSVSIAVEGAQQLSPLETGSLFRIAQEALNNILKHSQSSQAQVRLYLQEPFCMEVEDQGQGFDLQQAQRSSGFGLASMRERANEIGWMLQIKTSPGTGTLIRVEKPGHEEAKDENPRV